MAERNDNTYLICTRRKGQPKKHIDVCHKCRWRGDCKAYRKHAQPKLPLEFGHDPDPEAIAAPKVSPPKPPKAPAIPVKEAAAAPPDDLKALLDHIQAELLEIRRLC